MRTEDRLDFSELAFLTTPLSQALPMHLSMGLELRRENDRFELHGGPQSVAYALAPRPRQLLGFNNQVGFLVASPIGHAVDGNLFVEALIRPTDVLNNRLRSLTQSVTGVPWSYVVYEQVLTLLMDLVDSAHFDSTDLNNFLREGMKRSAPHRYAFFYANIQTAIEDLRTVLLRAMGRFSVALSIASRVNRERPIWNAPLDPPWEIKHSSPATQGLYDSYVDCVLACSSSLDLLYRLLVHLASEPFGNPALPERLELASSPRSPVS